MTKLLFISFVASICFASILKAKETNRTSLIDVDSQYKLRDNFMEKGNGGKYVQNFRN